MTPLDGSLLTICY